MIFVYRIGGMSDAGVDRTVVSKIERAVTNPSIEILLKLANQLDVDLNDLFAN